MKSKGSEEMLTSNGISRLIMDAVAENTEETLKLLRGKNKEYEACREEGSKRKIKEMKNRKTISTFLTPESEFLA